MARRFNDLSELSQLGLPVRDPDGYEFCQICKGSMHTVVVTCDGRGFTWGGRSKTTDPDGPVPLGVVPVALNIHEKIIQLSCGSNHTLVLTEDRKVYAFGETSYGRLGLFVPQGIPRVADPAPLIDLEVGDDDEVCHVAAGGKSSFAITKNGRMFAWGSNDYGQLGLNSSQTAVDLPTLVETDPSFDACEVSVNDDFAFGYDNKGDIWTWGGGGQSTPTRFGAVQDMQTFFSSFSSRTMMIASGQFHLTFLTEEGSVYTLGYNRHGQLGVRLNATVEERDDDFEPDSPIWTLTPQLVEALEGKDIRSVFAAGNYTVALSGVLTPHNCPCARGGRKPTQFYSQVQMGQMYHPVPPPRQPEREPSDVFGPVAPFVRAPQHEAIKPVLPGEVDTATQARSMGEFRGINMWEDLPPTAVVHPMPELPARPSNFVYYPPGSDEAKAFATGQDLSDVDSLFGRDVVDGYFYGDDDQEVQAASYKRRATMPSTGEMDMPEGVVASGMRARAGQGETDVFSLSLQDEKVVRDGGDQAMREATMRAVKDMADKHPPVDFDAMGGSGDEMELVRIGGEVRPVSSLQPL